MDVIPFDPRRFRTAAASYAEGRPAYPPRLFRRIAELVGLGPNDRAMDLGCGPGPVAIGLAPHVGRVVAVDPEPEMLKAAAERAAGAGAAIELALGSSYDLGPGWGRFRLVAMGRSFHWMDRADVLRRLDAIIEPGGAVVLLHDEHPDVPANAWHARYREVVDRYAADDVGRRVRGSSAWADHLAVLLDSPFRELERVSVYARARPTLDVLARRTESMSSVSRARLGPRADELAAEVREAVAPFLRDGALDELIAATALIATRPEA